MIWRERLLIWKERLLIFREEKIWREIVDVILKRYNRGKISREIDWGGKNSREIDNGGKNLEKNG